MFGNFRKERPQQAGQNQCASDQRCDTNKKIADLLIPIAGNERMADVTQHPGFGIRFKQRHLLNLVTENQTHTRVTQFMHRSSQPTRNQHTVPAKPCLQSA